MEAGYGAGRDARSDAPPERPQGKPGPERPNVLWLMSDQHHADCMGHAGRSVRTPHLDALAARGVRFTQAFCNNPICAPSRISFITGQYPHHHRHVGNNVHEYPEQNPDTLAALARRHGYQTAVIGKAHMIRAWNEEGFEHIRYCDLCDGDRNDPLSVHYFRHLHEHGLADAYDLGRLPPGHPGVGGQPFVSSIPYSHSVEAWTGDEALAFLRGRDRRRSFFAQVSFQRPHAPLSPSPEQADLYRPEDVDLPASALDAFERGHERAFASKPAFQRAHVARHGGSPFVLAGADELRRHLAFYYTLITVIDEQIGRLIGHLAQTGDLANTVIV